MSEEKKKEEEIIALLALCNTPNVGDVTAKKLISFCGSAENVFKEKSHILEKINKIGETISKNLCESRYMEEAEEEYKYVKDNGIKYVTFYDDDYPANLQEVADSPIIYFEKGNINFEGKKIISIVGTRQATSYGVGFCESFLEGLESLRDEVVIVSGFAYGIDITAHKKALELGMQTVGCLAHGIETIYPSAHKRYEEEVMANGGFITDFWHKSKFDRRNFLKRNRIIAGLGDATVVIESGEKGGSLVTAEMAFGYDRNLFAVPGRVGDYYSVGCNALIKSNRAVILTGAEDFLEVMKWDKGSTQKKEEGVSGSLFFDLSDEQKVIFEVIKKMGRARLDEIAQEMGVGVSRLSNELFEMEMNGVVVCLPGKVFEVVGQA